MIDSNEDGYRPCRLPPFYTPVPLQARRGVPGSGRGLLVCTWACRPRRGLKTVWSWVGDLGPSHPAARDCLDSGFGSAACERHVCPPSPCGASPRRFVPLLSCPVPLVEAPQGPWRESDPVGARGGLQGCRRPGPAAVSSLCSSAAEGRISRSSSHGSHLLSVLHY